MIIKGSEYYKIVTKNREAYGKIFYDDKKKKFLVEYMPGTDMYDFENFQEKVRDRLL